jgi:hypothetical protein
MKKIFLFLIMSFILVGFVFAQGNGAQVDQGEDVNGDPIVCAEDVKECFDGSFVSRNPQDNCNFAKCPEDSIGDQIRKQIQAGDSIELPNGKTVHIREGVRNRIRIEEEGVFAECEDECNLTREREQNKTRLKVHLSNGRNAEVKIMPSAASEKALGALRLHNCVEADGCTIELKEVGSGNETKPAYELERERPAKVLGLFRAKMKVRARVDAETGDVLDIKKPWWAFLASEPEEETDTDSE